MPLTVRVITVHRSPSSHCLPSLKLQIENALAEEDPWELDIIGVRLQFDDPLGEEEINALNIILHQLDGPAMGWKLTQQDAAWRSFAEEYEFTIMFRCVELRDLVKE